jgi:hypothetical protein
MTTDRKKISLCLVAPLWCTKGSGIVRSFAAIITKGDCLGLLVVSFAPQQVTAADKAVQLSYQVKVRSLSTREVAAVPPGIETQPNVPVKFFNNVVSPVSTGTNNIVSVLPETRSNSEMFALYYDVKWR